MEKDTNKRVVVILTPELAGYLRKVLANQDKQAITHSTPESSRNICKLIGVVDSAIDLSNIIYRQN